MDVGSVLKELVVLYVEDDNVVRPSMGKFLRRRCKKVIEAENGQAGFEEFKTHNPDVVITDVEMPVMNGIDMIDKIHAISESQTIIITTAYSDLDNRGSGVCINLIKPIIKEQLIEAVVNCISSNNKKTTLDLKVD